MKLTDVLRDVKATEVYGSSDVEITGIACDSRLVREGFLFVAIRGEKADGHLFIEEALGRGAKAIMCEPPGIPVGNATRIVVSGTRRALAQAAATFHANPSKSVGLVGITGTNGKTTVCHLVGRVLEEGGWPCGLIGTVEYRIPGRAGVDEVIPAERTTPDAVVLNSLIARMNEKGCRYVVMEVSSHSLDQERVAGLDFDVAVFTNLTRDHLDYHQTMANYLKAKALLFQSLSPLKKDGFPRRAVVCTDQPDGWYIASRTLVPVLTYGFNSGAAVTAGKVRLHAWGASFVARTPWGTMEIESRLIGRHNVCNILAAIAVGLSQGVSAAAIRRALEKAPPVRGRLEFVPNERGYSVVVDYAHTDDALKNVLVALREITRGKLIAVFGCGGDRDRGKRKKMGAVAGELADYVVVTSDNPRSEDPLEIISQIVEGCDEIKGSFAVEPDRRKAIAAAIFMAKEGDTVLIAGKGHETYQEFKGYRIHFDDAEVAREVLASQCPKEVGGEVPAGYGVDKSWL